MIWALARDPCCRRPRHKDILTDRGLNDSTGADTIAEWGQIMCEVDDYGWGEVGNAILLKKVFGYWPAFHDAHVLSIKMEYGKRGARELDVAIELRHWGQDNPNWVARGPDCVITLILLEVKIADVSVDAFVHDNSVGDLCFTRTDDNLLLFELDPNSGASVFLACTSAEITRIEPYCASVSSTTT